jgi:IS1 family transposase
MWSDVGKKAHPHELWHVIDHHTGQVLADVFGRRKDKVFLRLQALLEPFDLTRYYTDGWGTDERYVDTEKSIVGNEHMQRIESKHINGSPGMMVIGASLIPINPCSWLAGTTGIGIGHICFPRSAATVFGVGRASLPCTSDGSARRRVRHPGNAQFVAPPLTALGVRTMGVCGGGGPVRHCLPAKKGMNTTMID